MQATTRPLSVTTRRERWGWYLYDFGNSAYAAVVLLAVYSAYFQGTVVGGPEGTRLWGIAVGIAMLVVAVTSPVLGAIADYAGAKKRFLLYYTVMACLFTGLLYFVQVGDVWLGIGLFVLAEIGYRSAQVFYNSLLPEITTADDIGRISGNGWAIGSAGGIICLLIVLPLIVLVGGTTVVRLSLVITAVFYAISASFIFLWLREKAEPQPLPALGDLWSVAFGRLTRTFRKARDYREFIKFMIAFIIFNDGIIMALDFAAIIGAVLFGMEQQDLIIFIIIVQVASVAGAYLSGVTADRWGTKRTLIASLLLMMTAVSWIIFAQSIEIFYVIGILAGFSLTGVQAVSRTFVAQLSPPGQSAEFYGLFAVAGRTSSFIGPTLYGIVAAEAALRLASGGMAADSAEQLGQRIAIGTILVFLAVGLVLLLSVDEQKGKAAARAGTA